ncbi:MAG: ATPase, partial [Treponemataceae bacterium]|nr:ATPase [Treponemataceae bacterium]
IEGFRKSLESDILFETVYSGMGREESGASSDLAWISGFVPADSFDALKEAAAANSWALAASEPSEDDPVPTKLKNNRLVSLIYPLTDFLGTVPGYHEYDISGWFLLFFTVFFGMIFGDGGYGLLVTAVSLLVLIASAARRRPAAPVMQLVLLLGISTVVWGTVTCTWFGLPPEMLPEWLKNLSVPPISNAFADTGWIPFWTDDASKGTLTSAQNLQIFCFTLALLQLSVAHIKGMARNRKSLKVLGEFGSMLQLWGMFYVVLSMVVSSTIFSFGELVYGVPVGTVAIGLVAGGFVLSFIFSNYEGNLGESVMTSVKGIISVLLGVVNVFSDIVSYIRLWAVGLAGAAISNTVNEMAGPILGHAVLFLAAVVLLVFGHGLNMILNVLSVIVHGVRLNTLEFSTHLGMSWSGFKYDPFRNAENK